MQQLRDAAEQVIREWDAHERARGGRPVMDFDCYPEAPKVTPAASRLDVYEQLGELLTFATTEGAESVVQALTAHRAYLRAVLGQRPGIGRYVEQTQGCPARGWTEDYVSAVGDRAQAALADLGISWGPDLQRDFDQLEGPIDLDEARATVQAVADESEPAVRKLTGTDADYVVRVEIVDVDDYWAYWLDGVGHDVRLRFNLRQAVFTRNRLRQFAQHELLGHALQCASYTDTASRAEVDWLRMSSVHLPYQVCLEGLATALPLFVSPDDAQLVARTRLDHYVHLVRARLHLDINSGATVDDCATYARTWLPWWTPNELGNELADRSNDPMLRSYLWSYPAGTDWFVALADHADASTAAAVFHAAYGRPLTPTDLAGLWPAGPTIGGNRQR